MNAYSNQDNSFWKENDMQKSRLGRFLKLLKKKKERSINFMKTIHVHKIPSRDTEANKKDNTCSTNFMKGDFQCWITYSLQSMPCYQLKIIT